MTFRIVDPPIENRPSRHEKLKSQFPQALSAISKILESSNDIRYGSPKNQFLSNYHFQSVSDVELYFRQYLKNRYGDKLDTDLVNSYVKKTINRRPNRIPDNSSGSADCFSGISSSIIKEINYSNESRDKVSTPAHFFDPAGQGESVKSLLRFVIGSTGAGKTAFSKALFCVSLQKFWTNSIVPTRVEYSKISTPLKTGDDEGFYEYVRRCQLRDLLIYFLLSGRHSLEEQKEIFAEITPKLLNIPNIENNFNDVWNKVGGHVIDSVKVNITDSLQILLQKIYSYLTPENQAKLLYTLTEKLDVSFLISFDGFDAVYIDDFFFEGENSFSAVDYITRLVRRLWDRQPSTGLHLQPVKAHYLVYLRDTSYERLRTELIRDIGGQIDKLPEMWIAPPKYEQMVKNAAIYITNQEDPVQNRYNTFTKDTWTAFNAAIFNEMEGLSAQSHLSFVFASNARQMKRHIVRSLVWALDRSSKKDQNKFFRDSAGVNAAWLWKELVKSHTLSKMHSYTILEELYLNESRQLLPTLNVVYTALSKALKNKDYKSALLHVRDRDEVVAAYGCVLNYFLPRKMWLNGVEQNIPQTLILVRMLQFVEKNHRCVLHEIFNFVISLGYKLNDTELRFCFYLLIRNQVVRWDSSVGGNTIDVHPLYITTKGRIMLRHLLRTITYVSESMLDSLQCNPVFYQFLLERDFSAPQDWVVDCIHNASLYLHQIEEIENIESTNAKLTATPFDDYLLADTLREALCKESKAILESSDEDALKRHEHNLEQLSGAVKAIPNLIPLGAKK